MKLQSIFDTEKAPFSIDYKDSLLFLGSCFGENISKVFINRKFQTLSNPFGVVFNPISIFDNLNQSIDNKEYTTEEINKNNEIYSCFDFHSDMSALKQEDILSQIQIKISETNFFLKNTTVLFLTLGTAWIYEYEKDQNIKVAANCHKFSSMKFKKRLLKPSEIIVKADETISKLKEVNKDLKIVFTISPVRHLKDGFVENNQSKSVLHLALKDILDENENTFYFPAYEYIMDELRDYRFFSKDLVHPNELAVQYVLEKFDDTFFKKETLLKIDKVESIKKSLEHKVKFKQTDAFGKFQESTLKKIQDLEALGFDFSSERIKLLN